MLEETTTVDWNAELVEQLDYQWQLFRPRLDAMTDDAYLWEPVPDCWTVRRQDNGRVEMDAARDMDGAPEPPPFTTAAWRLAHVGAHCLGMRAANHFGVGTWSLDDVVWPATAGAGRDFVDDAYERWVQGVRGAGPDGLARKVGPAEGPYADFPLASLVLHINREVLHHAAEVLCLLELHRHTFGTTGEAVRGST